MNNMPEVKVGIVAVSRDCFPESLSVNRRKALVDAYTKKYDAKDIYECPVCIVESEIHMVRLLKISKKQDVMHFAYILETSDRRFPRHFLQNISKDRRCSSQQQRKHRIIFARDVEMLTAVC